MPNVCRKTSEVYCWRSHQKRKSWKTTFWAGLGIFRQKSFAPPKICLLLHIWNRWIMKTRHSKYSFALSIHSDVRTKPQRKRRIATSLQRCILTSHVILTAWKETYISVVWHSGTLVTLALIMDISNLWKHCYRLTHASFHKLSIYVAYRYQHVTISLHYLHAKMCVFNSLIQQNPGHRNIKWTFADLLPCLLRNKDQQQNNPLATFVTHLCRHRRGTRELQVHHCMTL